MTDRISVKISSHPDIDKAISEYRNYIKAETLAEQLDVATTTGGEEIEWLDGQNLSMIIKVIV